MPKMQALSVTDAGKPLLQKANKYWSILRRVAELQAEYTALIEIVFFSNLRAPLHIYIFIIVSFHYILSSLAAYGIVLIKVRRSPAICPDALPYSFVLN